MRKTMVKTQSEEDREEGVKDLVEIILRKMVSEFACSCACARLRPNDPSPTGLQDEDKDGKLSRADFEGAVKKDDLLLEAFGTVMAHL